MGWASYHEDINEYEFRVSAIQERVHEIRISAEDINSVYDVGQIEQKLSRAKDSIEKTAREIEDIVKSINELLSSPIGRRVVLKQKQERLAKLELDLKRRFLKHQLNVSKCVAIMRNQERIRKAQDGIIEQERVNAERLRSIEKDLQILGLSDSADQKALKRAEKKIADIVSRHPVCDNLHRQIKLLKTQLKTAERGASDDRLNQLTKENRSLRARLEELKGLLRKKGSAAE